MTHTCTCMMCRGHGFKLLYSLLECDTGCAACSQVAGSNSDTTCLPGMCKLGFAESSGTCHRKTHNIYLYIYIGGHIIYLYILLL